MPSGQKKYLIILKQKAMHEAVYGERFIQLFKLQ